MIEYDVRIYQVFYIFNTLSVFVGYLNTDFGIRFFVSSRDIGSASLLRLNSKYSTCLNHVILEKKQRKFKLDPSPSILLANPIYFWFEYIKAGVTELNRACHRLTFSFILY